MDEEHFDINIGNIDGSGIGHRGATDCMFKIRKGGMTLADGHFGIPEAEDPEENAWSAIADRDDDYPEGDATGEVWCSNGGAPMFRIGGTVTITFNGTP